jgi:CheY-like chemotaxis protein
MRILVAEDNPATLLMLKQNLTDWGYEVVATSDGVEAWKELHCQNSPHLVLLDWKMPLLSGLEVCRLIRQHLPYRALYVILLTANAGKEEIVAGLTAGADDYMTKPFELPELQARLQAGARIVALQENLAQRVRELEDALARVHQLQGLLPMCAWCKRIRDDHNYWQQVEAYLSAHADVHFSHGICPDCLEKIVEPDIEAVRAGPHLSGRRVDVAHKDA